ncbi:MAG: preprotein translocase subunit YajC [Phycisphaerae bacterium]|nr:preprotein translocase subunit YajC [Phycisphaerae bacterium]
MTAFAPTLALQGTQDAPSLAGVPASPSPAATTAAPGTTGAVPGGPPPPPPAGPGFLYLMAPIVIIYLAVMIWGSRREGKKKRALLEGIKKHDRVQTIGGVIGSVVELKPETVVLKVDESSNTRITFARSAIVSILKESSVKDEQPSEPAASKSTSLSTK